MRQTGSSTDVGIQKTYGLHIQRESRQDKIIALAGNPNVGKSTLFNQLTGLNQHTGNWPGKTVATAQGTHRYQGVNYIFVDLPGTYSLMANSTEEEIARDFICFGGADAVVVVADATCLERNLNLVLQAMEITPRVILCVNLMDESKKKKIRIDLNTLSEKLGIPVVGSSARSGKGLDQLMETVKNLTQGEPCIAFCPIVYSEPIEQAVSMVESAIEYLVFGSMNPRWLALKLLEGDPALLASLNIHTGYDLAEQETILHEISRARAYLEAAGIDMETYRDWIVSCIVQKCEDLCRAVVRFEKSTYAAGDRRIDRLLTSKTTGIPIMILLMFGTFWLTISGANVPSALIADVLFRLEDGLMHFFTWLAAPEWVRGLLVEGMYRTLAWVVSAMLPPMAIFFPLFTLLEDSGYLPRIAFNLDNFFRKACAHGKQALTMCMGFGCNAAGVIGCRIIDSPREQLIAIITNNFVPCNGRFPTLIAIITVFFAGAVKTEYKTFVSTGILTAVIGLGVAMTILISKLLSKTLLKGMPSSFHLELPPYRRPQIGKVIVRSIFDRTLFVLSRAVVVAAPAGLILWTMANLHVGGTSLLVHCASFLDPFGRLLGLDGIILMAFILGFPANEIVVPIILMGYMATGSLTEMGDLSQLHALFVQNGWTWLTAVCVMLFSLMHWPCSTTCLTIQKETKSLKWTFISFAVPTVTGILICLTVATTARLFGWA